MIPYIITRSPNHVEHMAMSPARPPSRQLPPVFVATRIDMVYLLPRQFPLMDNRPTAVSQPPTPLPQS